MTAARYLVPLKLLGIVTQQLNLIFVIYVETGYENPQKLVMTQFKPMAEDADPIVKQFFPHFYAPGAPQPLLTYVPQNAAMASSLAQKLVMILTPLTLMDATPPVSLNTAGIAQLSALPVTRTVAME